MRRARAPPARRPRVGTGLRWGPRERLDAVLRGRSGRRLVGSVAGRPLPTSRSLVRRRDWRGTLVREGSGGRGCDGPHARASGGRISVAPLRAPHRGESRLLSRGGGGPLSLGEGGCPSRGEGESPSRERVRPLMRCSGPAAEALLPGAAVQVPRAVGGGGGFGRVWRAQGEREREEEGEGERERGRGR